MQPKIVVAGLLRRFSKQTTELSEFQFISWIFEIFRTDSAPAEDEIGVTTVRFDKRNHTRSR